VAYIVNVRLVHPRNLCDAIAEVHKVSSDADVIRSMASEAFHFCMFVEDIPRFVADIIKQEMLRGGGNAVIHDYSTSPDDGGVESVDVFLVGSFVQVNNMVIQLVSRSGVLAVVGLKIRSVLQVTERAGSSFYCCGKYRLELGKKTFIMGILNVTADSFSGDGLLADEQNVSFKEHTVGSSGEGRCVVDKDLLIDIACRKAEQMVACGADVIDVGGESTRPGFTVVDEREELDRVLGVVERLVKTLNVPISVDTSKSFVAENVLKAGAHIINDVNGLIRDPKICELAVTYGAGVIAMHNPDEPLQGDIFSCITKSLRKSVDAALKSGLKPENIALDPGIGFGKTLEQNLEVMRRLDELKCLGYPILLGTSRKSMIGKVLDLPVNERVEGTAATVALGIAKGVDFIRVHDVKEMYRVTKMSDAIIRNI
jgi:dihydropteroate synthase